MYDESQQKEYINKYGDFEEGGYKFFCHCLN